MRLSTHAQERRRPEELHDIRAPAPHRDVDLLVVDPDQVRLDGFWIEGPGLREVGKYLGQHFDKYVPDK